MTVDNNSGFRIPPHAVPQVIPKYTHVNTTPVDKSLFCVYLSSTVDISGLIRYTFVYVIVEKRPKTECYPQNVNNLWTVIKVRGNLYPQPVIM